MVTRRHLLALTGSLSVAGCLTGNRGPSSETTDRRQSENPPSDSPSTPNETEQVTETEEETSALSEREQEITAGIPLDGLGAYEDQMLEAGPVEETTAQEITQILEGAEDVQEEAELLSQKLTDQNFGMWMAEYHRQKDDPANSVVVNENYGFFQDSGPILEIYTVENGKLQSGPTLSHTSYNKTSTHKPGDGPNPRYLLGMRNPENSSQFVVQSYESIQESIEDSIERNDVTEQEVKEYRAIRLSDWSRVMFGVDDEPDVIPHDVDTADKVFNAMHGDGNAQILAELSNQYHEENKDPDTLVAAEYNNGWKLHTPENREMGDPLKGEEDYFS